MARCEKCGFESNYGDLEVNSELLVDVQLCSVCKEQELNDFYSGYHEDMQEQLLRYMDEKRETWQS